MCVLLGSHLLWGWGAQSTQTSKIDPYWDGDKSTSFLFQFSCIDRGQQWMWWQNTHRVGNKYVIYELQMFCSFYSAISKWIGSSGSLGSNASKDVESSKFSFSLLSFSPGVTYGGKMIEFLCKVEFPASPRTSRVPVRQNQVWQNVPSESPFEEDFKYSSTAPARHNLSLKSLLVGILQICHQSSRPAFRSNSPSECLQTPRVGLESKSFLCLLPNQMELIRAAVGTLSKVGEGEYL